tara:strand:+ start:203 stop:685 length:483 start_codon:yes stop_codon:yes gene_type:complete
MAYLVFKNEIHKQTGESLPKGTATFIKAAKTDADLQYLHNGIVNTIQTVEITDEEFDSLADGSKDAIVENDPHTFEDFPWAELEEENNLMSKEGFDDDIQEYKDRLTKFINKRPNHSQIGKVTSALDWVTNFDTSSITYPTTSISFKAKQANKFVSLYYI